MSVQDEKNTCANPESDLEDGFTSPSLDEFRGFQAPKVVIERLDLTPNPSQKLRSILKEKSKFSATNKFFVKCTVDIFNQDLDKLKELYTKKPELLNSPKPAEMSFKCNICEKEYESEKKLLKHHENKHVIVYKPEASKSKKRVSFSEKVVVHEVKEYHKCRKCSRIFESYVLLKAHTKEQHRKRKSYICHYCSKNFVDRSIFKVHIKLHCEACGQLFPSKTKCNAHRRLICRTLKLHECKKCNATFFHIMDLKEHSYDHLESYICDICKDQCKTKCALAHHIFFLHLRKHKKHVPSLYKTRKLGNESLFLCKFCEESSVDKDVIEAHVNLLPDLSNRAMTGYKDYYFCDQCLQKFDTEQDMLQHKWTHFLKIPKSNASTTTNTDTMLCEKNNVKRFYNINEEIPSIFKPKLVLQRIRMDGKEINEPISSVNVKDVINGNISNATAKKLKKTLISKHQCENCGKYLSSAYCLRRHIETQHADFENLRCNVCEEVFVWPSLLLKHKCIRLHIPEIPFDDARPEIHFDNLCETPDQYQSNDVTSTQEITGFDDLNITENFDYMNTVDFEIPEPIGELNINRIGFSKDNAVIDPNMTSNLTQNASILTVNMPHRFDLVTQSAVNVNQNIGLGNSRVVQMNQSVEQLSQNVNSLNDSLSKLTQFQSNGYKLVVQEVPIEF